MLSDGVKKLNTNIQLVNGDFCGDLKSCMIGQVESLHATHHHKNEAGAPSLTAPEVLATQQKKA